MLTAELMQEVKRLEIRARRRVEDVFAGQYHSAFRGQGVEFAEVREYEPGDDIRTIDWNVTARTGKPFIKRFSEERQLTIVLVPDLSGSGRFGTRERTKGRLIVETAAVLAMAAARNGDRVGLLPFADKPGAFLPPKRSRSQVLRVIRELLAADIAGTGGGLPETLRTLDRLLHRRAIVFVLSDFLDEPADPADRAQPAWLRPAQRLASRHELIALTVSDPAERNMPPLGLVELEDAETGRRTLIDAGSASLRRRLEAAARRADDTLIRQLRSAGVDRVALSTDRSPGDDLARYFHARERRR
jgi:uncharacterized protein (DUF58 family)